MKQILIVDDNRFNLITAADALKEKYEIYTAKSGMEALSILKDIPIHLILLDIEMPHMDGIETMKHIKADDMINHIPVIFLTGLSNNEVEATCLNLGAQDFIAKPFYKPAMLRRIARVLELEDLRQNLEQQVIQKTEEVEYLTLQTITTFANAIDAKDSYTNGHSLRVAKYSEKIVKNLGWSELETRNLYYTALLHDIGKIGIPDSILNKPDKLTQEEFEIVKTHPEIGEHILKNVMVVPYLGIGAYYHHEHYDGTGYPTGKKGEDIPLVGRIIGIADAVDAMRSDRSYRKHLEDDVVISELKRCSGTHFDPLLVDIMVDLLHKGIDLSEDETTYSAESELLTSVIKEYVKNSKIDALTGLWNRAYVETKINTVLREENTSFALLMIDLDNFKRVNDTWGHLAGDSLLVNVATAIRSILEKNDMACRAGGDEFIIYLESPAGKKYIEEKTKLLIHRIKEKVDSFNSPIKVTASVGIAFAPEHGKDFSSLYHNADKALYYVKQKGKNNYYIYGEESEQSYQNNFNPKQIDIKTLMQMLTENEIESGPYQVNVKEFEKIYQLLRRNANRNNEALQIILFTFTDQSDNIPNSIDLEDAVRKLVTIVRSSLRIGDVAVKYSSSQYVLLLKDITKQNALFVIDRILRHYNKTGISENVIFHVSMESINE